MAKELVDCLYGHSDLNPAGTVENLTQALEDQLSQNTGLNYDNIPSYCQKLDLIKVLLACIKKKEDPVQGQAVKSVCNRVVDKVCLPILTLLSPTRDSRQNVLVLLGSVSRLIAVCVSCDHDVLERVVEFIRNSLDSFLLEKPSSGDLAQNECSADVYSICETLRHTLQSMRNDTTEHSFEKSISCKLQEIFHKLVSALELISTDLLGSIFIPTLLKLLEINCDSLSDNLEAIWKKIQDFSISPGECKHYLLLCGFANHIFPVTGKPIGRDVLQEPKLWQILQHGLLSKDSLNRKRCLYLVKRIIDICESGDHDVNSGGKYPMFWWRPGMKKELSKVWEDFMLLAEVFEEKQVHVIRPLLPRINNLIRASACSKNQDYPLLHSSWIVTLLRRSSHHESLQIIRWSVETTFTLDYTTCPFFEQGQDEYLGGGVLDALHEPKLFTRDQGSAVGSLPVIAVRLEQFFNNCWKCLSEDKRGPFFSRVVQNICNTDWGPYSLLFICRALSLVPASPCLNRDTVQIIRKLLTGHLVSIESYLRGAILCYITEIVIHLTDKKQVLFDDCMQVLAAIERNVCLQRGTTLWTSCVDWLQGEVNEDSDWSSKSIQKNIDICLTSYLETSLDSSYSLGDRSSALVIARQFILASDAGIATNDDGCQSTSLIRVLEKLKITINSVNTHAYMSQHKVDKAIQLLVIIVQELGPERCKPGDPVYKTVMSCVVDCQAELSTFIGRQITDGITSLSDVGLLKLYMAAVEMLTLTVDMSSCSNLQTLVNTAVYVLDTIQTPNGNLRTKMKELSSMCILGLLSDFLSHDRFVTSQEVRSDVRGLMDSVNSFTHNWKINLTLQKPTTEVSLSQQEWGRVTSLYLINQWRCVRLALLSGESLWCEAEDLLNQSTESLSVGMFTTTIPIMQSMKLVIPHVLSQRTFNPDLVVSALECCLSSLLEVGSSLTFWRVLDACTQAVFQPCLLRQDEESPITQTVKKISRRLLEMNEKQGVVLALARHLCKALSQPDMVQHGIEYTQLLKELCIHGEILKRGNRQLFDISAALEQMEDTLTVNQIMDGTSNQDILARAVVINFLCKLDPSDDTHCCVATNIVKLCIDHYKKMPMNAFANSLIHLQRHRLIQTVLLLEAFIVKDYASDIWSFVWTSLQQELQPSVRHMLEWLAMWLMYRYDHLAQQLWVLFDKYQDTKNIIVCSLLCIVTHMGPHLPEHRQTDYYEHALSRILPWCMAHHFNTRIFAQAAIVKLWQQCNTLQLTSVLKAHSILGCLVEFNQQNKNSTKNVKKLLDSFFFKFLDFRRDFSLETLYYLLPLMTSITEEDWIKPELFVQTDPGWDQQGTALSLFIQLRNNKDHLSTCDPDTWKYRSLKSPDDIDDIFDNIGEKGDVQKKIMPWKQMVPDEETSQEMDHGVKHVRTDGLIVVTSLINKVPNLGGLCRTSEIFGVSEYIMGSLKFLEDKAFQSLSVTAHKWLPITEVHESKLSEYLQQKREQGYCLVGAEQTANSVCLTEYRFPQKTLLLLGNEKEGIPVDLISLLDVCVEIPQQGVIRSLNVHVSGALLIWEYWRQQLTNSVDADRTG